MLGETLNVMPADSGSSRDAGANVGGRLREAREARNMELRDIASTTKISIGALEALEQNDFDPLPGGIFTRAFVRAYASEVGLDPEQTTRDFMAQAPAEAGHDPVRLDEEQMPSRRQVVETVFKLLIIGVPLAGLLFLGLRGTSTVSPGQGEAGGPVAAIAEPVSPPPPAPVAVEEAAVREPLAIVLRPRGQSWVSMTVDGERVLSRIMQAGEEESYEAEDEITINIGNAGQFDFMINGQPARSLGGRGEVVTATITHANYLSYVEP